MLAVAMAIGAVCITGAVMLVLICLAKAAANRGDKDE